MASIDANASTNWSANQSEGQPIREVGVFGARTHLSELLAAVEAGETARMIRRGKPAAELRPEAAQARGVAVA